MARTKDVVLAPEQKELMEKEYLDFVKQAPTTAIKQPLMLKGECAVNPISEPNQPPIKLPATPITILVKQPLLPLFIILLANPPAKAPNIIQHIKFHILFYITCPLPITIGSSSVPITSLLSLITTSLSIIAFLITQPLPI